MARRRTVAQKAPAANGNDVPKKPRKSAAQMVREDEEMRAALCRDEIEAAIEVICASHNCRFFARPIITPDGRMAAVGDVKALPEEAAIEAERPTE